MSLLMLYSLIKLWRSIQYELWFQFGSIAGCCLWTLSAMHISWCTHFMSDEWSFAVDLKRPSEDLQLTSSGPTMDLFITFHSWKANAGACGPEQAHTGTAVFITDLQYLSWYSHRGVIPPSVAPIIPPNNGKSPFAPILSCSSFH